MTKSLLQYYLAFVKKINYYFWSDKALKNRKWYIKYGFSILLLAMSTAIKLYFYNVIGIGTPFLLYFAIVILATGFGGVGPGIFTSIVSALISTYYFHPPFHSFYLDKEHAIQVLLFIIECLMLISLSGAVTRASRNLRRTGERFRSMIENSADAISVLNIEGKILYVSPAIERVLGYTVNEFKKLIPSDLTHSEEKEMLDKAGGIVFQSPGKSQTILHRFLHKNGSWVWIESTLTNLINHPGINGIVSNFRNVTEKVLLERQKDDFVGVATHELKTPVTSIKAYAQILLNRFRKEGNETSAILVEKMDVQLNKLIGLIGDMLDVTKIEGGRLQFQEDFYDFNILVIQVAEELQRTTNDHEIVLKLDKSIDVYGDRERIAQVFTNLLSNAIKYSPSSQKIIVTTARKQNHIKLCVEDHGLGISTENQSKIFERFYRVSGPENLTFPGVGLGLYISHEIIKRQGGRIWVNSKQGEGSTFCFELPYNYSLHNNDTSELKIIETHEKNISSR